MTTIKLPNVTLVAMGSTNITGNIKALEYSAKHIKFGSIKFITSAVNFAESFDTIIERGLKIRPYIEVCYIDPIRSIDEWNYNVIFRLGEFIDTDYAILVHPDGFIVHADKWWDGFLQYDYIGAPWPLPQDDYSYRDKDGNLVRVGNSVSLRSKRLIDLAPQLDLEWKEYFGNTNEDGFICCHNRHEYTSRGMKFAPLEVARYFSHETMIPEIQGIVPFAFHKHAGTNSKYPNFEND